MGPLRRIHKTGWKIFRWRALFHLVSFLCSSSWGVEYPKKKKKISIPNKGCRSPQKLNYRLKWLHVMDLAPGAQSCNSWAAALRRWGSALKHAFHSPLRPVEQVPTHLSGWATPEHVPKSLRNRPLIFARALSEPEERSHVRDTCKGSVHISFFAIIMALLWQIFGFCLYR